MVKDRHDLFTYLIIVCNTNCTIDHIIRNVYAKLALEVVLSKYLISTHLVHISNKYLVILNST